MPVNLLRQISLNLSLFIFHSANAILHGTPPPSSPNYASFDPLTDYGTSKSFPDMVNYMDSKIRTLINKVKSEGFIK